MLLKKELLIIGLIAAIVYCLGCKANKTFVPGSREEQRIDLFRDNPARANNPEAGTNLLSPDTAFKYCAFAIAGSDIRLTDSSYNRTTGDNFYLYSAFADSTLKGKPLKAGSKLYFTSYKKFNAPSGMPHLLFLMPLANHTVIRSSLHVQLEWMPNAPFTTGGAQ